MSRERERQHSSKQTNPKQVGHEEASPKEAKRERHPQASPDERGEGGAAHVGVAPSTAGTHHARRGRDYGTLFLRGVAMGAADIVPGVSGGTMALILGIYEELINSLRSLGRPPFWRALLGGRVGRAFEEAHGRFLITLVGGIAVAVLSLSRVLEWLILTQPVPVWSFFFGLIAASVGVVARRVTKWRTTTVLGFVGGAAAAFALVGLTPASTPESALFLFLSGALAICALILPGISGAFILVLLGKYEFILGALNRGDVAPLVFVALGAGVGILSFAQVLGWLFRHYYNLTLAVLGGFMLGSLRKVWPWKAAGADVDADIDAAANALPALTQNGAFNAGILVALLLALVGFVLVLVVDRQGRRHEAEERAPAEDEAAQLAP